MSYFSFILIVLLLQEIPFKPKDEFEVKIDYEFRQRPVADLNTVHLGRDYERPGQSTVLPYLTLNVKMLALKEQKMRVRITNNLNERSMQKRVSVASIIELDLGFTDDMKDRVTAHEYILTFIDEDKMPVDRIVIDIGEDGTFLVNGENRGKF